jgi:hypothetical protein
LGSFPSTLEGSQNIFVAAVATRRDPDSTINDFGISRERIIIPEQTGVRRDSKPTLTEHHKGAIPSQHSQSITKVLSAEMALGLKWNIS